MSMWTLLRLNPLPNDTRTMTTFLILGMSSRPLPTLPDLRCDRDGIARKLGDSNHFKAGENVVWCKENPSLQSLKSPPNAYFGVLPLPRPRITNL